MIGIINYGAGNLGSLSNAFSYLGIPSFISGDIEELQKAKKLVLPGVGAFGPAMDRLKNLKLDDFLNDWVDDRKYLLGICLGMQLLLSESEENGTNKGLNLIPGRVKLIKNSFRKVHIGWNQVKPTNENLVFSKTGYAYFVHSYACHPVDEENIISLTEYGNQFVSGLRKRNVIGLQFHPEKSQEFGLRILKRFYTNEF